ncbi:hypothetical protein Dda_1227 [Drechslerella dactyloides]|uniref:Uncharacterized protein n=1 Tax=Drechslerella dactyloides TaxID=74499 RepID=A0AAD6NNQ4_DREDA|nr:hypothetical protein Dda_1227 [Drechslerella dactyloides]
MANALRNALLGKIWSWLSSPFAYWEWILRRREKAGPEQVIFSVDEDDGTIVETLQKGTINIQMLSVTPFSRRQRAVQFGKPNPIQYGQSFDCHDHGNSSTGALYDDILPAIETLANFPEKSDCKALPDGCYLQACSGTAGIYLCNKSLAKPVQIKCQYIERIAREVYTNYIGLHQDQNTVLDFCRRVVPITTMTGPKGREYTGNSFRKKEFATAVGDDMWSLQINRTGECYADQTQPRGIDDQLRLGG